MYKGKLCASTTWYNDKTRGSCGCGPTDPVPADWWTMKQFTAALNCKNLDPEAPLQSWCPKKCGGCYRLCTTGGTTQGEATEAGACHVFKVTNRCGDGFQQSPMWCSNELTWEECKADPARCRQEGSTNWYGYPAHFDLMNTQLQITGALGWENVEVTFEPVPCSEWDGPSWDCQCKATSAAGNATGLESANTAGPRAARGTRAAEAAGVARSEPNKTRAQPFCCLAARDRSNRCGTCREGAAVTDGHCGESGATCATCGGEAAWCEASSRAALMAFDASEHTVHDAGGDAYISRQQPMVGALFGASVAAGVLATAITAKWLRARAQSGNSANTDDSQPLTLAE